MGDVEVLGENELPQLSPQEEQAELLQARDLRGQIVGGLGRVRKVAQQAVERLVPGLEERETQKRAMKLFLRQLVTEHVVLSKPLRPWLQPYYKSLARGDRGVKLGKDLRVFGIQNRNYFKDIDMGQWGKGKALAYHRVTVDLDKLDHGLRLVLLNGSRKGEPRTIFPTR